MKLPRISIVTICYNHGRFLEGCLRSVLDQNYPNLEYIVIDGGSTDGSVEIIKRYAGRLAYWVSEPDGGQAAALVKGFRQAAGDIEGWLNADDELMPGALQAVASFFTKVPQARVVTGDTWVLREDGSPWRLQRQLPFLRFLWFNDHNYIAQSSTFWKRDLYEQVGGLNPRFNLAMDSDLFIRFADVTRLHKVRNVWSRFRVYPHQKTMRLPVELLQETLEIRRRYYPQESMWSMRAKRLVARPLRMLLKLIYGCYF